MDAAAHNPAFAKKVGIPQKVAKEFSAASKGQKFRKGGDAMKKKCYADGGLAKRGEGIAEELERFLRSEPILANPATRISRLQRWGAKNLATVFQIADEPGEISRGEMCAPLWRFSRDERGEMLKAARRDFAEPHQVETAVWSALGGIATGALAGEDDVASAFLKDCGIARVETLEALLEPGDEVLLPAPDYPLWTAAVVITGAKPVRDAIFGAWFAGNSRPT